MKQRSDLPFLESLKEDQDNDRSEPKDSPRGLRL